VVSIGVDSDSATSPAGSAWTDAFMLVVSLSEFNLCLIDVLGEPYTMPKHQISEGDGSSFVGGDTPHVRGQGRQTGALRF